MNFICNVISSSCVKEGNFHKVIKRYIRSTALTFNENHVNFHNPKEKITVVKRKFLGNKQTSTALEWKSASSVIKRLNWENKHLFGPVQTSKASSYDNNKIVESDQIIQHETRIPIIEPSANCYSVKQNNELHSNEQKVDLQSITAFPLINKFVHSSNKINEVNYLRKHLEFLCKDSSIPSVTSILQKTMPKERVEILDKWKKNMIQQLGEQGFERYQKELLANGVSLHHTISSHLSSAPESELHIKAENAGHWRSLEHIFPNVKDVKLLEEFVTHPFLCYKGVVDCFAKYKNHLVVIDWKSSKKSKSQIKNTYDDPLQIAAYVGALNFDPKFQYLATKGLIVIAYESGMPATAHFIDQPLMKRFWNEWLKRVKQFWEMKISEANCS